MDAFIYAKPNGIHVTFTVGGITVDEAGPFDDETEAVMMAERSVFNGGKVHVGC